jgi:hypothetical protein
MKSYTLDELEERETLNEKQEVDEKYTAGNSEKYKRGTHPVSLANLKPWPKGISGNELGRPYKYESLKKALNEIGKEINDWDGNQTNKEKVLNVIWSKASFGDLKFIQMLAALGCLDLNADENES